MRFIAAIMTILLSAFSSLAATNVKAGDVVPEDGVFLTVTESAKIIAEKKVTVERCDERVDHATKMTEISDQLKISNLETDLKAEREKRSHYINKR